MTVPKDFDWSIFPTENDPHGATDPVDFVAGFIPHFSFDLQLRAMRSIIARNREVRDTRKSTIDELNKLGKERGLNHRELGDYGELFFGIMYQESADSLVLSALMTAFLEELFTSLYSGLSEQYSESLESRRPSDPRWGLKRDKWRPDVSQAIKPAGGRGLASGVFEIARAIELHLPTPLEMLYDALTAYRHAILHNSLDWERDELTNFSNQIADRGWKLEWFDVATTNDEPSMYALTDIFADELLKTVDQTLVQVGQFLRALMRQQKCRYNGWRP
jgi:hypothetical protein